MKTLFIFLITLISFNALSQGSEDEVRQVVTTAYINGIHNGGPVADIRAGFHPSFNMLRLINNEVSPLPIEDWIKSIEKSRGENTNSNPARVEGRFVNVMVSGKAANVTLELYRGEKKIFTDYLLLYQFNEGWRIVSKSFFRHP